MKKLLLLVFLVLTSFTNADTREPFLEGIQGVVKLNFSDGSMYEGQIEECLISGKQITCFNGVGLYTFQTGYLYEGEFKDNKPNGQGVMTYLDDGRSLEGEFKENMFIGG